MKQTALFFENNPIWLEQLDSPTLLFKMLELFGSAPVYIVDKDQQVLYWSLGMEALTGLRQENVVGKSCLHEYAITEAGNNQEQLVKISCADGNKIEVKKVVRTLHDGRRICWRYRLACCYIKTHVSRSFAESLSCHKTGSREPEFSRHIKPLTCHAGCFSDNLALCES
jgi:PAS domain S-box-containing protein